jgi:hypothetical protein
MKFIIIKILALLFIFSIAVSSLKRRRVPQKNPYEGSELDVYIGRIAQKMCKNVGRDATYIFFGKIKSFIDGTLENKTLYDKIFRTTFSDAIKDQKIDLTQIERQIMTTVQTRLGGNSPLQNPSLYWKQYAENMYQQNQAYLNGLVAGRVVEHGISAAPKQIISNAMSSGGAVSGIVVEKLIEVVINIIQMNT